MPDWTYQTIFKPALFRLAAAQSRDLVLSLMGTLARLPFGGWIIDFMGHMRADPRLRHHVGGLDFDTRVGLGQGIDPNLQATRALARFGFGFIEVGPISMEPRPRRGQIERQVDRQAVVLHDPDENPGLAVAARRVNRVAAMGIPVVVHIDHEAALDTAAAAQIVGSLSGSTSIFALPVETLWGEDPSRSGANATRVEAIINVIRRAGAQRLLAVVTAAADSPVLDQVSRWVVSGVVDGVGIDGTIRRKKRSRVLDTEAFVEVHQATRVWRDRLGANAWIVAKGGVHDPQQALELIDAGADLISVDSGLVFTGPGLPKRINEALLFRQQQRHDGNGQASPPRPPTQAWFWAWLMGLSMVIGGAMALIIAATRVVLPYDESIAGMTRDELAKVNDRLLPFMTHDRVSLAGTMLAVGVLYSCLSWFGIRRGLHWAWATVLLSASLGFASFFLFLGFGYFDPFHAFVTAILFQFLLMMVHSSRPEASEQVGPGVRNDWRWRTGLWGQLVFVFHGGLLVIAGVVISRIGITSVFVPEDLEFMRTSAEHLLGAHPNLVPLVAHDRATFGGMLLSCGVAVWLPAMWGYRRGRAWLWWALMVSGHIAYLAAVLVHWHVGYMSLKHLMPAYGGLLLLWIGGALSYPYLCQRDEFHERFWARYAPATTNPQRP